MRPAALPRVPCAALQISPPRGWVSGGDYFGHYDASARGGLLSRSARSLQVTVTSHRRGCAQILISAPALAPVGSASGLVSRASPVQTAVRNCTRDEGGPFGFGDQVADPKPPQAAVVKSHGGERCGNAGTMIPAGTVERGERKRTVGEVSKAD